MVDFVDINGARLAYRVVGPEDAPLMITLHGGRGMGEHEPSLLSVTFHGLTAIQVIIGRTSKSTAS